MTLSAVAEMLGAFRGRVETDLPLSRFTTYRLGGPAGLFVEPAGVEDLEVLGAALRRMPDVPVLPLGRGSNLVISDAGFEGIVVRIGSAFSWIEARDEGEGRGGLEAGAAASLPQVANWAARRGLAGLEWAISIPGSVGGGVRMNAGAHGGEMDDVVVSARVFDVRDGSLRERDRPDLGFSYRRSILSEYEIVADARFSLLVGDREEIKERMESYRKHRAETQPGALQNAGSVFKNPSGDSAGRLVESCGLKGFTIGGARVSELHANFFIAGDGATAQDVFDLVGEVRSRVRVATGVDLEPEIRFVGAFRDAEEAR